MKSNKRVTTKHVHKSNQYGHTVYIDGVIFAAGLSKREVSAYRKKAMDKIEKEKYREYV